jgi:hypothetical protein
MVIYFLFERFIIIEISKKKRNKQIQYNIELMKLNIKINELLFKFTIY